MTQHPQDADTSSEISIKLQMACQGCIDMPLCADRYCMQKAFNEQGRGMHWAIVRRLTIQCCLGSSKGVCRPHTIHTRQKPPASPLLHLCTPLQPLKSLLHPCLQLLCKARTYERTRQPKHALESLHLQTNPKFCHQSRVCTYYHCNEASPALGSKTLRQTFGRRLVIRVETATI